MGHAVDGAFCASMRSTGTASGSRTTDPRWTTCRLWSSIVRPLGNPADPHVTYMHRWLSMESRYWPTDCATDRRQ